MLPITLIPEQVNAYVSELQEKILKEFLPGPFTFILKKKAVLSSILTGGLDTIGVRIPDTLFMTILSNYLEVPYTATSANYTGMPTSYTIEEIKNQFGEEYLSRHFSTIVESQHKLLGNISTIVDITIEDKPKILREGFVETTSILNKIEEVIHEYHGHQS